MKKLGIILAIVAVAAVAFAVGWQYRGSQAPPENETVFNQPPPAVPPPATEAPAAAAPAPAATARRQPATPPAQGLTSEPAATPASAPVMQPAPAAEPAPVVKPPVRIRLAEGTNIVFALNNSLSTKTNREGDEFSGVVSRSVRVGETIAIPEGSIVRGTVAHVERPGRVKGRGELGLRFDQLELPDGQVYDLSASLTDLGGEKETVGEEGEVKGEGTKTRDAATIGAGAGIGAVIGAISGGGKGAATGGAIGAGAGTGVVLLTRGKDVEIRRGAELAIQLDRPLAVVLP